MEELLEMIQVINAKLVVQIMQTLPTHPVLQQLVVVLVITDMK